MALMNQLQDLVGAKQVQSCVPLSAYTSFKIGGPADYLVKPIDFVSFSKLRQWIKVNHIPYYIMGNGSNVLALDEGFRGVVIQVAHNLSQITITNHRMVAQSGALLSRIANEAAKAHLSGLEFASGIPGTLGGAVYMNAGAYGGEMKDVIVDGQVMDEDGTIRKITVEDLELGYRSSCLQQTRTIILEATMALKPGNLTTIKNQMRQLNQMRQDKQPIEWPSAGSAFKRPVGYYAGQLIMTAGLSGYRIGGALVSTKHCGFVINAGNATASDVLRLLEHIQNVVFNHHGVHLEPEVRIMEAMIASD